MTPRKIKCFLLMLSVLLVTAQVVGQAPRSTAPTIDQIMEGPDFSGTAPSDVRWSVDGQKVYFRWKTTSEKEAGLYVVDATGGTPTRLSEAEEREAPPSGGVENSDATKKLFVQEGDIHLLDLKTGARRRLTSTVTNESDPGFTLNADHVYYTFDGNLYLLSLSTGAIQQTTDFRRGPAPREPKPTESQKFLEDQQKELLKAIVEELDDKKRNDDRRKSLERLKPIYLEQRQTVRSLQLSPDEKLVTFILDQAPEGVKNSIVPDYITASGYTEDINSRSKVGDVQRKNRMGILDPSAKTDPIWVDHGQGARGIGFTRIVWSPDGKHLAVMTRSEDNKDRWISLIDTPTGKTTVLDSIHDDAWVGGPESQTLGWLPDSSAVYFVSEKTGWAHLYTATPSGQVTQWTDGKFEIFGPTIAPDKKNWFLTTSEVHLGERHFYRMPIGSRERVKLTTMVGNNQVTPSPDGTKLAIVYSYSNKPWDLYVDGKKVTDSPSEAFKAYAWREPELVFVPARDGVQAPARLYKPAQLSRGAPAVVFVHGSGYLQNVHKWWSSYSREYMFHNLLVDRGYVVLDIDYRASAGHGRDWRTAIYRYMGDKDLTDNVDGAKFLVDKYGVDPKRIGIYGGSYGGFITLMAMFTTPDVFAAGAALRPVTDWAHYNHGYTSNILNEPQTDTEAYKRSSPIYFAEGLKGALLICHGMVDTNVHFQDTVRLVQRLIELRKENWELAAYPVEDHGFTKPASWADEYKRILKLFETNLKGKATSSN
ncbi:MAG: prolyl oligopeptidase family serine peptidase [Acidobacteria bacterium]|nr:prolyl oligopeptidase family serine peptidase [Acidobacteriota bacterium]